MGRYFPRDTRELDAIEPPGFRRLTLSLAEMALITGVILRLFRAVAVTYGPSTNWLYLALAILVGSTILFGMVALHLANFTPRRWLWRAPIFGLVESATEMVVSLGLILLGREPIGSSRAVLAQWPAMAANTILFHTLAVCIFAAALAGTFQLVRRIMIAKEPNPRVAASLRAELFSEAAEPEIKS